MIFGDSNEVELTSLDREVLTILWMMKACFGSATSEGPFLDDS